MCSARCPCRARGALWAAGAQSSFRLASADRQAVTTLKGCFLTGYLQHLRIVLSLCALGPFDHLSLVHYNPFSFGTFHKRLILPGGQRLRCCRPQPGLSACPGAAFTLGGWGWAASPTGTTLQCSASATQGFAGCKHPPACWFSYSAGFTSSRAWSDADTGARVGYSNAARAGQWGRIHLS